MPSMLCYAFKKPSCFGNALCCGIAYLSKIQGMLLQKHCDLTSKDQQTIMKVDKFMTKVSQRFWPSVSIINAKQLLNYPNPLCVDGRSRSS